jgi:hypothetical protein
MSRRAQPDKYRISNYFHTRVRVLGVYFVLATGIAPSATLIGQFTGVNPSGSVQRLIVNGNPNTWTNLTVGRMNVTRTGGTDTNQFLPGPTNQIWSFCIEPQQGVSAGSTYTWNVSPLEAGATNIGGMGTVRADQVRELLGAVYPWFNQPLASDQAAALQVALWEIIRETSGTLNVSNGNIQFRTPTPSNVLTLAQSYLNQVDGVGSRAINFFALTNESNQDLIVQIIPEPSTFALFGIAVVLILLSRLRRPDRRLTPARSGEAPRPGQRTTDG